MRTRRHLIPDVVFDQILIKLHTYHSARDAVVVMDCYQVSSVLVVDAKGRLRGIFTLGDVARRMEGDYLDPAEARLSQVMTKQPKCVAATESPEFALRLMQAGRFGHLPITDDGTTEGQILGIVSRRNLFSEEEILASYQKFFRNFNILELQL